MLTNLGDWSWEPFDEKFEKLIEELQAYFDANGTTRVPQGTPFGNQVSNQRAFYQRGKLSAERIERLSKIGDWSWEPRDDDWMKMLGVLRKHFDVHGTTRTSGRYKTPEGQPLGSWANTQRTLRRKGKLSAERIELLNGLGDWSWELRASRWSEWFELLQEHYEDTDTTRVLDDYTTPGGQPLGSWTGRQRTYKRRGKLSAERIEKLSSLGDWSWEPFGDDQWMGWFGQLQEYFKANGTARVPDDCPLGSWVGGQRRLYKKGKLSAERISTLERLGPTWSWNPENDRWMEMYGQLQAHYEATGSTLVQETGTLLSWAGHQRVLYRKGRLSAERIQLLSDLGDWSWGHADRWEKMFGHARDYHAANGTLWAPSNHRTPDGLLYSWMKNQCVALRNGKLSAERMEKLSGIDPAWWDVK